MPCAAWQISQRSLKQSTLLILWTPVRNLGYGCPLSVYCLHLQHPEVRTFVDCFSRGAIGDVVLSGNTRNVSTHMKMYVVGDNPCSHSSTRTEIAGGALEMLWGKIGGKWAAHTFLGLLTHCPKQDQSLTPGESER